jgi:lipoyl(octanoyl) transferase
VEELICKLLPFEIADGPTNMAADEVLLHTALTGVAALRFYGWSPPTLSLGYFQSESAGRNDHHRAALPLVRRATGGGALVHHREVTYALGLPPGAWQKGTPWTIRMHQIIATALATLGVEAVLQQSSTPCQEGSLCFHHFTRGDVMIGQAKVVGSAQRKRRRAVLQHGGILLARSPHAPSLPGIQELTGQVLSAAQVVNAVAQAFAAATSATFIEDRWSQREREEIDCLKSNIYATAAWNAKR